MILPILVVGPGRVCVSHAFDGGSIHCVLQGKDLKQFVMYRGLELRYYCLLPGR